MVSLKVMTKLKLSFPIVLLLPNIMGGIATVGCYIHTEDPNTSVEKGSINIIQPPLMMVILKYDVLHSKPQRKLKHIENIQYICV
jgi:hypothetical protein